MNERRKGLVLLGVQLILVLSVVGKYAYERKTSPRVWTRAAQFDPELPMRGRYLALQLTVDGCGLAEAAAVDGILRGSYVEGTKWSEWPASIRAKDGRLIAHYVDYFEANGTEVRKTEKMPCDRAILSPSVDYFIPEMAKTPFPLEKGQELWVEVTVPPTGPPRPIRLALSKGATFDVLKLR